jgi:hypothetical protein
MKNVPYFVVAGLVVVLIIFIMRDCSRPGEQKEAEERKAYEKMITEWKGMAKQAVAQSEAILKDAIARKAKDSLVIKAQDREIYRLKNRTVVTRVVIQPMVDTIPALKAHLEAQDSLVASLETQSDTLKHALLNQEKYFMGLVVAHEAERRISERMVVESLARVEELQKQNRKVKRQNKLLKVGIVALPVAAIFLMAQ